MLCMCRLLHPRLSWKPCTGAHSCHLWLKSCPSHSRIPGIDAHSYMVTMRCLCRDPPKRGALGAAFPCCRGPPPLTRETVRRNCVEISGIDDKDLLYFSHSNVALSHLPYMITLDRWTPAWHWSADSARPVKQPAHSFAVALAV